MNYQIRVIPPRGCAWYAQHGDPHCLEEAKHLFALLVRVQPHCKIALLAKDGFNPAVVLQEHD